MIQSIQNQTLKQRFAGGHLLQISVVFVAYMVAGKLGQATTNIRSSNLGPVWPAYGIALAAILVWGYRMWIGVAAGAFLVAFFSTVPHIAALGQAAGATLAATSGAFLLHRIANFRPSLSRLSDALSLIALGGFGSAIVSASIGVSVLYATHVQAYSGLGAAWLIYWLGDATGVLLVTPLALRFTDFLTLRDRNRIAELAILLLLVAATCFLIFGDLPFILVKLHVMAFAVLPFIIWAAIRFGLGVTALSILIVAVIATIETALGCGPFASNTTFVNAALLDVFFGVLSVSGLSLAAVIAEREYAEREREQVVSKQAAMEARHLADEALRESEERLRLAAQAGKMLAYEWDASTDVIVRSAESLQLLGKDEPRHSSGEQIFANCHPDDRARLIAAAAKLSPERPHLEVSYRTIRPDGTVIWVEGNGRGYFDERGKLLRIIGMVADVTERKKTEEALQQREEELLEAQRVSQVGSWQWNPQTDEVVWSKELYRIAGRDPHLPPPTFEEQTQLYTPESWERLKRAIAEALQTGAPYTLDLEIVCPDGSTRWITDRGEALRDGAGRITRLRGTAQDITERKHAEDELRASEERFRSVFRDAGVGMVIVSPEGRFLAANQAFCDCLGYTEEELLEKTVQSVTLPEDWPSFSQRLREALEQGTGFQKFEKRCLHKSGRIVTTESSASLIRGSSGEPRYFVGEVLDITQRKLAEEVLSGVSGRLIDAHEEERNWIARELHDDFNQRMALLAIILERVKEELPATKGTGRRRIEEASQHIKELASDIQALSHRLHSSKLEYLGLVAAVAGFCQEFSNRQNVKIDFQSENIPETLPKEVSLCLFRVVQEALQNSLKHSGERRFEVSLKCGVSEIELTVHDSGVGFNPEKVISGHGLGLTSMKERLKLVDGQLSIDSKPRAGTTIHARVPLSPKVKSAGAVGQI